MTTSNNESLGSYKYLYDTICNWFSSTSTNTNDLFCYGSQEKRCYYPFNIESIKTTMCKFGNTTLDSSLKIWIIVKDNNGKMQCYIEALDTIPSSRRLWDQSALELKCRDKEFTESCLKALDMCVDGNNNTFLRGVSFLSEKYKSEKKYRHADFFYDLYECCMKHNET